MSRDESGPPHTPGGDLLTAPTLERLSLLAEVLTPIAPAPAVRAELLRQLQGAERWTPHARRIAEGFGLPLAEVTEALRRISDADAWRPGVWPGSRQLATEELAAAHTLIAELPAGFHIARHRHEARELTYVLDGELIEDGRTQHGRGAFLELSRGTEHDVAVSEHSACLVVFGLRFGS